MSPGGVRLAALLGLAALAAAPAVDDLALGDAAWARRAEGEQAGRPRPDPIAEAIRHYERALARRPEHLDARWRLLRALHFAGDFASADAADARPRLERAREVADEGVARLAERLGPVPALADLAPERLRERVRAAALSPESVARLHFWAAIGWGAWSRGAGLLRTVREGVANRLHDSARISLALEPTYEGGGALRLLGRLHATLPRVPFVSGWVDRERAIPLIERAFALAPAHPGNRLLLGLTLLDLAPGRRDEALGLLRRVAGLRPSGAMRVEEWALREEARERLAAERAGAS